MENIIAIGSKASRLADKFKQFEQYNEIISFKDNELQASSIEEYENIDFNNLNSDLDENLFIFFGENERTACALKLIEKYKNKKNYVFYIRPNLNDLDFDKLKQERLFYNVFQEYARSGLFEDLYLINIKDLEEITPDLNLIEYENKIFNTLSNLIHNLNCYNHIEPLKENYISCPIAARINTIGIFNLEQNFDQWLFPVEDVSHLCYYVAVDEKTLQNDTNLLKKINDFVELRQQRFGKNRVKYSVFLSLSNTTYGILTASSAVIQKEK